MVLLFVLVLTISPFCVFSHERVVSWEKNNLLLTKTHTGWGEERCQACHALKLIHKNAASIRDIAYRKGYSACFGCHGTNGTKRQRPCQICHNPEDLPSSPYLTGRYAHDFDATQDMRLVDMDCLVCHERADMDGKWEIEVDLTQLPSDILVPYRHESEFCLRCHNRDHQLPGFSVRGRSYQDPLVAIDETWQFMDEHGYLNGSGNRTYAGLREGYSYSSVLACTECHSMHGSDNRKLIIDNSHKGVFSLSFRSKSISIKVDSGNYAQLCVMCHKMKSDMEDSLIDAGNGLNGVHRVNEDCTLCHTHGKPGMTGL